MVFYYATDFLKSGEKAIPHGGCNSCHINHTSQGTTLTSVNGNANLCISCHNPGGFASGKPFNNAMKAIPGLSGNSHSWDVNAINPVLETNSPSNSEMALRLPLGKIICSTCHNQHLQTYPPFLRADNTNNALCKDCHSARNVGLYSSNPSNKGSHPVGILYNGADSRLTANPVAPFSLVNSNVECTSCHQLHYAASADGNLLKAVNNSALCSNCHTYGIHMGMECLKCHQPHNNNKTNIFLICDSIITPNSGNKAVVFSAETGAGSYADGDAVYNGVCEVCHTSTTYHRNNSSGNHSHNPAMSCISCHPHEDAFMPSGDCLSCHNVAQDNGDGIPAGGRRAVVTEFPAGNTHAHYGAALDETDCIVCHDQTTHTDGYVDLIDADNSSVIYHFEKPDSLTSDPDVSDFCKSCHDSNGATRLASPSDPFANGNTAPDIATKFMGTLQWNEWYGDFCFGDEGTLRGVNSHHDISNADQTFSGAKIECLNCHGAHNVSQSAPLADPFNTVTVWTGTTNNFCLSCHNGGTGPITPGFPANVTGPAIALRGLESCDYTPAPWYVDYIWTNSAHGLSSKRGWAGYSGAPSYNMLCLDCHDAHGSYTSTNTSGNPYMIRDVVDGTMYVDDGVRPGPAWTGPPWNTFGINRPVVITISGTDIGWGGVQGLCNVCHASWENAYDWHSMCNACQTCHGHGQNWGENDWGSGGNGVTCSKKSILFQNNSKNNNGQIPLHLDSE